MRDFADAVREAEREIGYTFKNKSLLETALTHKTYSNAFGGENNERLEFLGDAVLELVVSEWLYRREPDAEEGKLTDLRQRYVSKTALGAMSEKHGLMRFLRYSGGEQNLGNKTVESLPEAILGAVYLDGGLGAARRFVQRHVVASSAENYKSLLQEYVQERVQERPVYRVREEDGRFECAVKALGKEAEGSGPSKKAAETAAAERLYKLLTERKA